MTKEIGNWKYFECLYCSEEYESKKVKPMCDACWHRAMRLDHAIELAAERKHDKEVEK